jgi:chromosome segregation ATPase
MLKQTVYVVLAALFFALPPLAFSKVPDETHNKCKDVADYVGCVTIFMGVTVSAKDTNEYEKRLREAIRLLPGRMNNTSLDNFSSSIQPFTDALSLASTDSEIAGTDLVSGAKTIERILEDARKIWEWSIDASVRWYGEKNCGVLNEQLERINHRAGGKVVSYVSTARFCSTQVRKEGEIVANAMLLARTLANDSKITLEPYRSVASIKEMEKWRQGLRKEIGGLEKELKTARKKLDKAEKKVEKKPTENNKLKLEKLADQVEALSSQLTALRADLRTD